MTAGLASALPAMAAAQQPAAAGDGRCVFSLDHDDHLRQVPNPDGTVNYFLGGDVRLSCRSTAVRMFADSVAAYNDLKVTNFLGHVRYEDSAVTMTADNGTYYKDGERWEARGNVVTRNVTNGSTLRGPSLDYYRAVPGMRDTAEMFARGRPRVEYVPTDSAGKRQEPYVIYGDRVRFRGDDRVYAGGSVTVDRSDFSARGDSLRLDSGKGQDGGLYGHAQMQGKGGTSFTLTGKRIDLRLTRNELTGVRAVEQAHAVNPDWDLTADTIDLALTNQKLTHTLAWGKGRRPHVVSPGREIRADSLAIDTPGQALRQARAFGTAWVAGATDSVTGERDQLWGDTVVADFVTRDSAGTSQSVLSRVDARKDARSYHLAPADRKCGHTPVNYIRGDRIALIFRTDQGNDVERVEVHGQVDGLQLEPACPPPDSAARDSLRADSAHAARAVHP
jgi:hypothetical protein